jgi:hypothetical protein
MHLALGFLITSTLVGFGVYDNEVPECQVELRKEHSPKKEALLVLEIAKSPEFPHGARVQKELGSVLKDIAQSGATHTDLILDPSVGEYYQARLFFQGEFLSDLLITRREGLDSEPIWQSCGLYRFLGK